MDLKEEIKNHLKQKSFFSIDFISLLVYVIECNQKNDLYLLAKALQEQNTLSNIVEYFGGTTIKVPNKEEYLLYNQIAIYFYFMEVQGLPFHKITESLKQNGQEISPTIIGRKLSQFREKLLERLNEIVEGLI